MKRIYFLLALCNAFACLYSQDIQVAILEPVGTTNEVTTMHRSMVRGEMVKAIGRQNGYVAFNRADIDQIMKEQNFQQSGMVDDATRKRLGAMQGVDCVCITKITKEGNNYYLEANLVDIESGQISNPATQYGELQGGSLANMLAACEKLAAELVGAQSIASNSTTSTQSYAASTTNQTYLEQQYEKARNYYNAQNYAAAVNIIRPLAEQGYARAQCNLGICYYNGHGVTQDYYAAASWYRKAAEQGYADAQNNLGRCYEKGRGVTQDYYAAVNWYRKAAEQGYAYAQYSLGWCYEYGQGVTKNIDEAIKWYKKAVENGDEDAQKRLDELQYFRAEDSSNSSSTSYSHSSSNFSSSSSGAIIMGDNKIVKGDNKTIIGNHNTITGNNNTIVGNSNTIQGNSNDITGDNNKIYGNNNKMKGKNNKAVGSNNK